MAVDSSGLLQGGIAFASGVLKQKEMEIQQQQLQAKQALDAANLQRQDAKLNMEVQDMKFNQSAKVLQQQFEQQKFLDDQKRFSLEYGIKKATLEEQKNQFQQSLGVQQQQLGLTARGQDIQQGLGMAGLGIQQQQLGLTQRGQDIQAGQFGQTFGLAAKTQEQDAAYKSAMLDFQKDPTNPDNILKMAQIAQANRSANMPLSDRGKLQADINSGLLPESAVAVMPKAPPGYRFSTAGDPSSSLEAIPGGPATKLTPQNAAAASALTLAAKDLVQAKGMLFDADGSVNRSLLVTAAGNVPGSQGREFRQTVSRALMSKLRLETGAAITNEEMERYESMFIPSPLDSTDLVRGKIQALGDFLDQAGTKIEGYQPVNSSTKSVKYSADEIAAAKAAGYSDSDIASMRG